MEANGDCFGLEASGLVRRVGPGVKDYCVGDRIMLLGTSSLATVVTVSESQCVKIPGSLSFDDAVTMPLAYSTAIYSLFNLGGLEKGQGKLYQHNTNCTYTRSPIAVSSHPQRLRRCWSCGHGAGHNGRH